MIGTKKAKRGDWKTKPMDGARAPLLFRKTFDASETERLLLGVLPQQMEDKWFIFEEGGRVFFHRSWTGNLIYELNVEPCDGGMRVVDGWVNANAEAYARSAPDEEALMAARIIGAVLLGTGFDQPPPPPFVEAPALARIWVWNGDLITLAVDAIVNAANTSLLGGGGVDGAIHRAAGRELLRECYKLGGCETGDAKMTLGHGLPASHVIHAVGPVWNGGDHGEAQLLASCYRRALTLAADKGLRTVAFPGISTGAFGYPLDEAARVAAETTHAFMKEDERMMLVIFCTFGERAEAQARAAVAALG